MPDFSKCNGEGCPIRDKCYRYVCKPDLYQYYIQTPEVINGKCDYQMSIPESKCKTVLHYQTRVIND